MSMDDVVGALRIFSSDMEEFTARMAGAASDLEQEHDSAVAVWDDTFSQQYRKRWQGFDGELEGYLRGDAPRYRDFLEERVELLGRYLNG